MIRWGLDGDRVVLRIGDDSAAVIRALLEELTALIRGRMRPYGTVLTTPEDPALARLFPDPVRGDDFEAIDVRTITEPSLIAHRLLNVRAVLESLDAPGPLDDAQELAWLKTLTDLRLVLAVRLGIERDGDEGRDGTEEDRRMRDVYDWLGATQARLLDVLLIRGPVQRPVVGPIDEPEPDA